MPLILKRRACHQAYFDEFSVRVVDDISSWEDAMAVLGLDLGDLEEDVKQTGEVVFVLKCITEMWGKSKDEEMKVMMRYCHRISLQEAFP
jgi:hypothetical protein